METNKQPQNHARKSTKPADAVKMVIGEMRISELKADELIKAMKQIQLEIQNRTEATKMTIPSPGRAKAGF